MLEEILERLDELERKNEELEDRLDSIAGDTSNNYEEIWELKILNHKLEQRIIDLEWINENE